MTSNTHYPPGLIDIFADHLFLKLKQCVVKTGRVIKWVFALFSPRVDTKEVDIFANPLFEVEAINSFDLEGDGDGGGAWVIK